MAPAAGVAVRACALFALSRAAAALSPASAATCAAIASRAPCGQQSDSQERCLSKGCCFDPAGSAKVPCFYPTGNAVPIDHVHIVQASHFDAGFAYTIRDVLHLWWYTHFPRALELGNALVGNTEGLALQFTAQCWLIDLFYNCPPDVPGLQCPTDAQKANLTQSIKAGYLTWHAFPFNSEYELHSADMLAAGVGRCHALDDQFGLPHKATASQRDVPGTTRSAIPVLLGAGVSVFSNGVNGASTPPFVPRAFMWRDPVSGMQLPTLIHPYGYGGTDFEDAVVVPGLSHALVFAWRGDNAGPPDSVSEIAGDLKNVQGQFPGASVFFSTFDNFTSFLLDPAVTGLLPVVEQEMGDTWVHGSASDPIRTAFFKRAAVLRSRCLASGACSDSDPIIQNFTRLVLKAGEHTWGKDIKSFLHDTSHWKNAELQQQIAGGAANFLDVISSWTEQRAWSVNYPQQALAGHALGPQLQAALDDLRPAAPPSTAGFKPFDSGAVYDAGRWKIAFDASSGAISTLIDSSAGGATWASMADDHSSLGLGHYVTLSQADYDVFTGSEPDGYYPMSGGAPGWYLLDFGKPNCSEGGAAHNEVDASIVGSVVYLLETAATATFLVQTAYAPGFVANFGAPAQLWTRIEVPRGSDPDDTATIAITYEIFAKTPTRLPEGLFLRFNASSMGAGPAGLSWRVHSLGGAVDPFDVVPGGNHHLHGFADDRNGGGISATKGASTLLITSDSAALAAFGRPTPLPAPVFANSTLLSEGGGFMLVGNTWGTNYPMWYPFDSKDANMRWRFLMTAS